MSDGHTDAPWNNPPTLRRPDYEGPGGEAWKVMNPLDSDKPTPSLISWLVKCPNAHPFWDWYVIGGCTLEEVEGIPKPILHYADAEYEFLICALDPEEPWPHIEWLTRPIGPDNAFGFRHLTPVNVVVQFDGVTRDGANAVLEAAAKVITEGLMSPDSDARKAWHDAVRSTADHYAGKHGEMQ